MKRHKVVATSRRREHEKQKQELKYQRYQDTYRQVSSSLHDVIIFDTLILCNQKIGREGESMGRYCFRFPEAPTRERERESKIEKKERETGKKEKRVTADTD